MPRRLLARRCRRRKTPSSTEHQYQRAHRTCQEVEYSRSYETTCRDEPAETTCRVYTEIKPYHPSQQDTSTYCTGTKVHFSREMNVNIINIYVPPARWSAGQGTQDQEFQPQGLQVDGNTILGGDVNAHSLSWDPYQPESRLGGTIEDWAIDDMAILNDGSHTRQNPSTGGKSVPDLTLASRNLSAKMDWSTGEGCGSDHLPIYSRISPPTQRQRRKRRGRFTHKKADWDRFRNKLDELIGKWEVTPDDTLKKASDRLASTIISAAKHAIPFGNGRGRRPPFWNEECQTAVDEREAARKAANRTDRTRQDVVNHQEARAHADKVINEEKAAYFHQKVKEMKPDGDMWGLIKAMEGRVQHAKPAVTIDRPATPGQEHPQKPAVTDKEKAELFCQSYARVSRLPKTKETDHDITIEARKAGNCSCDGSRSDLCSPFSQNELRNALGKLKKGRSPGVDGVTNDMLHQLTTSARQELLKVLNRSWLEGEVPPSWRAAEIIAIPKKGKPLSETRSYRPISLLSCIGKLAERLVQNRLQHWLERSGRISPNQAGFRRGHPTVDQLTRITQTIFDGFERQKHHRAILVLDYAQAYDRVWRNGLFAKMARIGIPGCATRWVRALLRDRRARVRWGETHSRWRVFQEGLPQGSVLAPLLWLIYCNDTDENIKTEPTIVSMFADDVAILCSAPSLQECAEKIQPSLDEVEKWVKRWKVQPSTSKCVMTTFSLDPKETQGKVKPTVRFFGEPLKYEEHPTFLGLKLDGQLTFSAHVEATKEKMNKRRKCLMALAGKSYGSHRRTLRLAYIAYIRSVFDYGAAIYFNHASITCGARTAGGRTEEVREINHRMYSPNQQRHRNRGSRPLPTRSTSKGTGGGGVRQGDAPTRARPRKTTAADHAEAETQIQSPRGVEARSSCSEGSRRAAPTATR